MGFVDPSELLRPEFTFAGKEISKFRDYSIDESDPLKERVRQTYRHMHLNQTVAFVTGDDGLPIIKISFLIINFLIQNVEMFG